jgi:nucleotide-binding universal stress UspA family protein
MLLADDSVAAADHYLGGVAERVKAQLDCARLARGRRELDTVQVSWRVLQETEVAPAIALLAERGPDLYHPFDLVALSTHGEGGSERWMLGGVAEQALWATPLPALVVRPASLIRP